MDAETELIDAAQRFLAHFTDNPPPSAASRKAWERLGRIAQRICTRAGAFRPGDFEGLRAILRDCTRCLPLLSGLERVPRVHRAFLHLHGVGEQVEQCLRVAYCS